MNMVVHEPTIKKPTNPIYLNVNNGAGLFLLDNMRFIRLIEFAGRW